MRTFKWLSLLLIGLSVAVLSLGEAAQAGPKKQVPKPPRAPVPEHVPPAPENKTACNYQAPIPELMRENFLARHRHSKDEQKARRKLQAAALRFRTENYGYFEGFGQKKWNKKSPLENAKKTRFMNLPVRLNEKVIPALSCIEEQIKSECGESYKPRRLSGIRTKNTYHNGQVSNHVYGIAIDIDPSENTCCRCVGKWREHPMCTKKVESIYERMVMPECWVHTFERFGFYWLGRDDLQDTMHFEFLGDPEKITNDTTK